MSKQKIRLILPGGGIRGCFQCGFIKSLQDSKAYDIDHVYGTSVGSILAPFVANNRIDEAKDLLFSIHSIEDIAQDYTNNSFLNKLTRPLFALFGLGEFKKFTLVDKALTALGNTASYEKCSCVAWDYMNKKQIWFNGEKYPIGMRGSSALFIAVPPVKYNDTYLIDGGCVENIPLLESEITDDFDGIYIIVNCNTENCSRPITTLPSNGLVLSYTIIADSVSTIMKYELDQAKQLFGKKLAIISPGMTCNDDVFINALDIDQEKMKKSFELGEAVFTKFHNEFYNKKELGVTIAGNNILYHNKIE